MSHFPPEISALAAFDGPFDAFRLPAELEHAADFDVDSAEIEFWFDV